MTEQEQLRSNLMKARNKRDRISEEYELADAEYEKAWDALDKWEKKNYSWTKITITPRRTICQNI